MPQAIPFRKDSARRTFLITSQTVSVCADDPASDGAVTALTRSEYNSVRWRAATFLFWSKCIPYFLLTFRLIHDCCDDLSKRNLFRISMAWIRLSRLNSRGLLANVELPSSDGRSPVFLLAGKNALAGCYLAAFDRELDSQFPPDA